MKTIGICGCGWLGRPLAGALQRAGYAVTGTTTREEKITELAAEHIKPFVLRFESTGVRGESSFFSSCKTLVLNVPPGRRTTPPADFLSSMQHVRTLVAQSAIQEIVFISSTSVYKDLNTEVFEEDADKNSVLYQIEQLFREMDNKMVSVIRFGGLIGPGRHPGRFLRGKKDVSGGDQPVNMIHLDDCIGVITTVIKQNLWNETFHAAAPQHPARRHFYSKAATAIGEEAPEFNEQPSDFKIVNPGKFIQRSGYTFLYPDPMQMI